MNPGKILAHYEVAEIIGKGGMGEVYRAHDTKLRRDVAIKVLTDRLAGDEQSRERFEREARVLASLNHANIATLYGLEHVRTSNIVIPRSDSAGRSPRNDSVGDGARSAADPSDQLLAAIREIDERPVRFVINTHYHGDHVGGNETIGGAGAVIIAHDNIRKRMSTDQFNHFWDSTTPAWPADALPVVTFNDRVTLHLNGEPVTAYHTPRGHTDGDAIIHFPQSDILHMGDVFFHGLYPFIDLDGGAQADHPAGLEDPLFAGRVKDLERGHRVPQCLGRHVLEDDAALRGHVLEDHTLRGRGEARLQCQEEESGQEAGKLASEELPGQGQQQNGREGKTQ